MESCCGAGVPAANTAIDLALALTTGFAMSVGHCAGMCGPLVSAFGLAQKIGERATASAVRVLSLYHLGRLTSYAILGGLFGWIGERAGLLPVGARLGGPLSMLAGALLLLFLAGLLGWNPILSWIEAHVPWSRRVGCAWGKLLQCQRDPERFALGFLNGWLPCGPVYALALVAAGTQSSLRGALIMLVFGLGTVPVLSGISWGAGRIPASWRVRSQRFGHGLLFFLAVQLVARGAAASGWIGHLRFGEFVVY